MIPNKPELIDYLEAIAMSTTDDTDFDNLIITLHGYLRILPEALCTNFKIFNGHPGDIVNYPELKGKDPVDRVTPEMKTIGAVIHKVTAGVDEGEIVAHETDCNPTYIENKFGIETVMSNHFKPIRQISEDLWIEFLQKQFKI